MIGDSAGLEKTYSYGVDGEGGGCSAGRFVKVNVFRA